MLLLKYILFKKNIRRFPKEAPDILIVISIETDYN